MKNFDPLYIEWYADLQIRKYKSNNFTCESDINEKKHKTWRAFEWFLLLILMWTSNDIVTRAKEIQQFGESSQVSLNQN